jgi:DNA-binding PadR family transcriptional regulator
MNGDSRDLKELLPLTHLSYHILLTLRGGPAHGYAIVRSVRERSAGALSPGTGSFYSALARMVDEGVVVETNPPADATGGDSRRRYYDLTPFGTRVLAAETDRLRALVAWAEAPVGG